MALFGKIIVVGLGEVGAAWFKVASKLNASLLGIDINKNNAIKRLEEKYSLLNDEFIAEYGVE